MESRQVYMLVKGTDEEPPMRVEIRDGMVIFSEDRGGEAGMTIIRMTPHRASVIGEALTRIADGIVKAEIADQS